MLRRRRPLQSESVESVESFTSNTSSIIYSEKNSTNNNNTKITGVWDDSSIRDYFNYKSESDDGDNDDYIDKLVDEQIERLSKPKIIKSNLYVKIFAIIFVIFLILLILFLALILFLESYNLNHPLYMHLLKLLQYVHYTSKGKVVI